MRAIVRLTPLLWEARNDPRLREIQRSFLGSLPLCLLSEPARFARQLVARTRRFADPVQRPDTFYAPHLPQVTFGERDAIAAHLEAHANDIRRELAQVESLASLSPSSALAGGGAWSTFPLMRAGRRIGANIALCPETWRAVETLPLLHGASGAVYFSILEPGTHVRPHCGPSNLRARYHLALETDPRARLRVGGEWRTWSDDSCLIFDDSFEHEVVHDGSRRRVILLVDCWRSELSPPERAFLEQLYGRLRGVSAS